MKDCQQQINQKMLANINSNFQSLITQLLIEKRYQKALERGMGLYQIKTLKIESIAPNKIVEMYYQITTKFYFNRCTEPSQSWYENQLRVFVYLLMGYEFLHYRPIQDMVDLFLMQGQSDWLFFSEIFNSRDPSLFEFQALSLLKRTSKSSKWILAEVSLLDSIIKTKTIKNKWNEIAKDLYMKSQKKFLKTGKQCRQYWINHLDPTTLRSSWNSSQDYELIKAVKQLGRKWAKVSKFLGGKRTEHMVKNRFKSLYFFEQKKSLYQSDSFSEEEILNSILSKCKEGMSEGLKLETLEENLKMRENLKNAKQPFLANQSDELQFSLQDFEKNANERTLVDLSRQIVSSDRQYPNKAKEIEQNLDFYVEDCISSYFYNNVLLEMEEGQGIN